MLQNLTADFPLHGLNFSEYDVLFSVGKQPGKALKMSELTDHLMLTQSSVSRLVDRMVARGLIAKKKDPDDARGILVEVTEQGLAIFKLAAVEHGRAIRDRFGDILSDDELQTLTDLCHRLRLGAPQRQDRRRG